MPYPGFSSIIPISVSIQGPGRRNDPAKNRAAISENVPQVGDYFKGIEKVTFSITVQCVGANSPPFLTIGSPQPPAAS